VSGLASFSAAALALLLWAGPAAAALNVAADIDRETVEINGNLYLTVAVSGDSASVPEPQLANMQNFNVYSSGRSQSISIINGRITTSVTFTYILTPRFLGLQKIPPITVSNGRDTASTPELTVTVTKARQASGQPQQAQPARPVRQSRGVQQAARTAATRGEQLFLKAEADRQSAYPGEQINFSIKFYTSVPLSSNPQYVPPSFTNLISEDLPPVRNGEADIGGVRYAYSEIKGALFGLNPGQAQIRPATVVAQVPAQDSIDPFDPNFFQKFMAMSGAQGQTREFTTETLNLEIKPLPAGAPAGFSGAVGSYTISAAVDRPEARAGEAVNFSVTIAGSGNLKTVVAPKFPELPDFKVFDTMSSHDVKKDTDRITGKKTFTYILVPRSEGRKTIPPVKFSYFDPFVAAYKQLETDSVSITVEKGGQGAKTVNFNPPAGGQVTASGSDIRYVSDRTAGDAAPVLAAAVLNLPWWAHGAPLALLTLSFWLARFNRFKLANPLLFRARRARSEAFLDIAAAEKLIKEGKPNEAVSEVYDSFMSYLSDKSGVKVGALTIRKAAELVKRRFPAVSDASIEEMRELWQALELRHFSPEAAGAEGASDLVKKYSLLVMRLEKELK
jgi:hypothetical protein